LSNYSVHPLKQDFQGRAEGELEERQLLSEVRRRSIGSDVQNLGNGLVLEAGDGDREYRCRILASISLAFFDVVGSESKA
jgi:hypothetical protein